MNDLMLFDALHRLLTLVVDKARGTGESAEIVINVTLDLIIGTAVAMIKSSSKIEHYNSIKSASYGN